tara:strand:- start:117 stop:413 length:297 start_codon:yes stop_codon:yes gene_type:complete
MAKKENDQLSGHSDLMDVVLLEKDGVQYRLSVSEFRESKYLSVREWYMDFEEEWKPSKNGFTMPYNLNSTAALYAGLHSLLSKAEVLHLIEGYLTDES